LGAAEADDQARHQSARGARAHCIDPHREWNGNRYGKSETEMWVEASLIGSPEWQEIVRVLAQGGDYYSIQWSQEVIREIDHA
jgi:hypothetical protein